MTYLPDIRGRGDREQAAALERWLRDVETGFENRILPVTLPVAAARNLKDFELAGVLVLNPFIE